MCVLFRFGYTREMRRIAATLAVVVDGDMRETLELDAQSRVLVIGSEGATDSEIYRQVVERTPQEVAGAP